MSIAILDKSKWGGSEQFDNLLSDIRVRRNEFDEQRYISHDVVEKFKKIGIYRAFAPEQFGGDNKTPAEFLQAIEAISAADGSSGWVASFGMNPAYLAALPLETIEKVWKDSPDVVFAGGIFPPQPAKKVDGGFIINGRWQFASGCMGATVLGVGILPDVEGGLPRMAVLQPDQVEIEKTWNVHGMVATGSFDLVVKDVFVPEEWTFVRGAAPVLDSPFFRYPSISFASQVLSVTTLGLAREALDIIVAMSEVRKSVTGAPLIGDRVYAQIEMAKAEAKLRSSRAFFYEATEDAWAAVTAGGKPTPQQTSMIRLATTNLTRECAEVVQTAYRLAGMTSTYYDHPLSRIFRDSQMATQHAFMGEITYQNAGSMLFGHKPLPGYL
ncbi:acyl-CoA dehydrogenase family protein [Dasania marina]|uniref:acyl-CoA dehydrogenase family protein n=1 Tax=Dasania marina TaxID=471499 RepID=UPI0030DC18CD|tara:strand:- start:74426 stop:75574 length:1149 start_codon:yes stop_codon:yes gene_type:complete